ncbi:TIGR01777 family oxidoreductase [Virgibacillus xinjiangensis]|uniref:TIGR01777 family oxidoreductase n=1 Tax=Virgibacillus xinjiangensis TaxID=393090 RepID=A0ABV7CS63_9BACI
MNILITGGTGFLGSSLAASLTQKGHQLYILTRTPDNHEDTDKTTYIGYDRQAESLPAIDAVINLAGESLFGYWTEKKKQTIKDSRLEITRHLIDLLRQMKQKPAVFISGSAVGYYGMSEELIFTEATEDPGNGFLAEVCTKWEAAASQAKSLGIRTVYARFGVILGKEGGALPLMSLPVKLFAGGKIGSGEQWMSWIHLQDAVDLMEFCLFTPSVEGPVNFTAPSPRRNKDFTRILAQVLKRPYWLPAPTLLMVAVLGEMSQLIRKGQYVYPEKALHRGFTFTFPRPKEALEDIRP